MMIMKVGITILEVHQIIFLLARDCSKRITPSSMPQLNLGNIRGNTQCYIPQFSNHLSTMMKAIV